MVERLVANEKVEGSNPFARSIFVNMTELSDKKCVACEGDIPPFDKEEIHKYLKKVDGWSVKSDENKSYFLIKEFKFKNFLESPDGKTTWILSVVSVEFGKKMARKPKYLRSFILYNLLVKVFKINISNHRYYHGNLQDKL